MSLNTDRPAPVTPLLEVTGLHKVYHSAGSSTKAIRDLTFQVRTGEIVCIFGPSNAGKTKLLLWIAGLLAPTSGSAVLAGESIQGPPPGMAVVFQEYARSLFPWVTVWQNVELPLKEKRIGKADRHCLIAAALDVVHMSDAADPYPWQLSGGMQQRVTIARAVAYEPSILLMDEPFAAVDAQIRADLEDLVRDPRHRLGITPLFVTHESTSVSACWCRRGGRP